MKTGAFVGGLAGFITPAAIEVIRHGTPSVQVSSLTTAAATAVGAVFGAGIQYANDNGFLPESWSSIGNTGPSASVGKAVGVLAVTGAAIWLVADAVTKYRQPQQAAFVTR